MSYYFLSAPLNVLLLPHNLLLFAPNIHRPKITTPLEDDVERGRGAFMPKVAYKAIF